MTFCWRLRLCNVKQKQRLGSEGIMKHAFFKEIDWSNMAALVPPFKPAVCSLAFCIANSYSWQHFLSLVGRQVAIRPVFAWRQCAQRDADEVESGVISLSLAFHVLLSLVIE